MMFIIVIGFFFHTNPASVCNITESSGIDQHQKAAWFLKTTGQCEEKTKRLFSFCNRYRRDFGRPIQCNAYVSKPLENDIGFRKV